jgi:hypothetical protein
VAERFRLASHVSHDALLASFGPVGWLAGAALVISLGSLAIAWRADKRAERAEDRAEEADRREIEARLEVTALAGQSPGTNQLEYQFKILNAGKVPAHHVRVWLVDETGNQLHEDLPGPGATLLPLEESDAFVIQPAAEFDDVRLALIWRDGAGEHVEVRDSKGNRLPYRPPEVRGADT